MQISGYFLLLFITKGYWIVTTTLTNPAFKEYMEAFQPWLESVGDYIFQKIWIQRSYKVNLENLQ